VIAFAAEGVGASAELPVGVWLFTLLTLTAGIGTALKGRYGWLAVGLLLLGVPWLVSCFLLAKPGSAWANALYGPEKLSRAERRASRRLPRLRA
jgi:hypothetical protein